jgi:preprotein translocase subunit YajC
MHVNYFSEMLAAAAPDASGQAQAPAGSPGLFASPLTLLVLMGVMMYFLLFRPQQQQRKKQMQLLSALKSGDRVVTAAGIVGVVITVKDKTVSLRSADAKMEVTKSSVTEILQPSGDATAS